MYKYDIISYKVIFTLLYMVKKKSMVGRGGEHPILVCVVYTQQRWRLQNFNNDVH